MSTSPAATPVPATISLTLPMSPLRRASGRRSLAAADQRSPGDFQDLSAGYRNARQPAVRLGFLARGSGDGSGEGSSEDRHRRVSFSSQVEERHTAGGAGSAGSTRMQWSTLAAMDWGGVSRPRSRRGGSTPGSASRQSPLHPVTPSSVSSGGASVVYVRDPQAWAWHLSPSGLEERPQILLRPPRALELAAATPGGSHQGLAVAALPQAMATVGEGAGLGAGVAAEEDDWCVAPHSEPPIFGAECAICCEGWQCGEVVQPMLGCRHVFHHVCVLNFLRRARPAGDGPEPLARCPLCRGQLFTTESEEVPQEERHLVQVVEIAADASEDTA